MTITNKRFIVQRNRSLETAKLAALLTPPLRTFKQSQASLVRSRTSSNRNPALKKM